MKPKSRKPHLFRNVPLTGKMPRWVIRVGLMVYKNLSKLTKTGSAECDVSMSSVSKSGRSSSNTDPTFIVMSYFNSTANMGGLWTLRVNFS